MDNLRPRLSVTAEAAYLSLADKGARVTYTVPLSDLLDEWELPALANINLDFDEQGRLLGIEFLDPSSVLPKGLLDAHGE